MSEKRFAILIDGDNISSKYIECIMDEMTKFGESTYRRIYGDFSREDKNPWKDVLLKHSIIPMQQFQNTKGKNATDSALIIDAMDILYSNNVDGFCIVSSDSDFTRLASRLRESGMEVIGMGENKTPKALRAACSQFITLEVLLAEKTNDEQVEKHEELQNDLSDEKTAEEENVVSRERISEAIIEIITSNENKGRDTSLGEIGSTLIKKYSDFDVRNYGYSSLSRFLEKIETFELVQNDKSINVILKRNEDEISKFIIRSIQDEGESGIDLGQLGQKVRNYDPTFKSKRFGYSTFQKYVQSIKGVVIEVGERNQKSAVIKED